MVDISFFEKAKWRLKLLFTPREKIYGIGHPFYYYRIDDRVAEIAVESQLGAAGGDFAIYEQSLGYWRWPHNDEALSMQTRRRVLNCICDYFDREGTTYEVIEAKTVQQGYQAY